MNQGHQGGAHGMTRADCTSSTTLCVLVWRCWLAHVHRRSDERCVTPLSLCVQMGHASDSSARTNLPAKLAAGLLIPLIGQSAVLADAVISGASLGQEVQCFALIGTFIAAAAWLFKQHLMGRLPSFLRSFKNGFLYLQPGSARRAAAG